MSIGIYAFLRIYFFGFGVSDFAQFRTHCADTPAPPSFRSTRRGLSGIECRPVQRVQRPGVCAVCAVSCVVCLASGTACAAACRVQSVRVRWGLGSPPAGYIAAAKPRPVSPATTEKIKKTTPPSQTKTHLIVQVSKFSEKYKKTSFGA